MARIVDRDKGLRALITRLSSSAKPTVEVGVLENVGDATHGDGDEATVLDVAAFHEFGTEHIPPRSFLRAWADEQEQANIERMRRIGRAVIEGKLPSIEAGLERFGLFAVGSIQSRMSEGIPPPLAESTIERKGSSVPLIDSGQLRSSITSRVTK